MIYVQGDAIGPQSSNACCMLSTDGCEVRWLTKGWVDLVAPTGCFGGKGWRGNILARFTSTSDSSSCWLLTMPSIVAFTTTFYASLEDKRCQLALDLCKVFVLHLQLVPLLFLVLPQH